MKRLSLILLLLAVGMQLLAQPTVYPIYPVGTPGYLFTPPPGQEDMLVHSNAYWGNYKPDDCVATAYRTPNPTMIYGVAVAAWDLEYIPYLYMHVFLEHRLDSSSYCARIDTMMSELYCFIERPPVHYASFQFVRTYMNPTYSTTNYPDTVVAPFYEFYFAQPLVIPANQRFYMGLSVSPYSVWNHVRPDTNYWPYNFRLRGYQFSSATQDTACNTSSWFRNVMGDGLDSVWGFRKQVYPGLVDWACYTCTDLPRDPGQFWPTKYVSFAIFPIVRPPEDSTRINLPHRHPLRPQAVQNFRLTELDSVHAVFAWDTMEPSDWGPVIGINANRYQINYAPYTQEYDEADTLGVRADGVTLWMDFDSTVMYKARCRARSHHECDIHNGEVYGDWSREVYFHTGVGVPDTAPLVCPNVVGLRYVGLWGGFPKFEWSRCPGHSNYDVQLAHAGRDDWHRVDLTSENNTMLRSGIDPTERYWLRVRAECNHHCHIHDTVMRSPWSDTLEFGLSPQGMDEVETEGLSLVPNPAHDEVTLTAEADITRVAVYDMQGHLVLEQQAHGREVTLSLRKLAAGSYIVHADTPRGRLTHKLTVE